MSLILKYLAAAIIITVWGLLAYHNRTPMDEFIMVLRDALIALGVFHVTMTNPNGPKS
jgi:hypothetical protein